MLLSTKTRYACRAMAELAAAYPENPVSVKDIARAQRLSPKYLEHIVSALKAAGLIEAVRGVHGGYVLSRAPEHITLSEVFRVLEGSPAPVDCVDHPNSCPMTEVCPTRDTWVQIGDAIKRILDTTTLRELAERAERKRAACALMYHI